jgi:carbon monoxide dehydrogenase subunit G
VKLEQSFEVQAPIERVWAALIDLEKVAPCLPGAAITGRDEDGTYHGTFQVKLGPTTASYRGTIRIESADESHRTATITAKGSDKRGQGGAIATIVNTLYESDAGTRVEAVTDYSITGRLASFGRSGMIRDISNRLLRDFATCLQQRLAAEPAGAAGGQDGSLLSTGAGSPGPGSRAGGSGGLDDVVAAKSPAEVGGGVTANDESPAEVGGGEAANTGQRAPAATVPIQAGPAQPPAASAPPLRGFSILFSLLFDRLKVLFRRR